MLKRPFKRGHIYSKPWKKHHQTLDPYVGWNALRLSNQHKELIFTIRTLVGKRRYRLWGWNCETKIMKRVDFSLMRGNSMMCFVGRGRFGNKPLLREINGQPMGLEIDHAFDFFVGFLVGCLILQVEDEGCHHFKIAHVFFRGLPLKPHPAYSMKVAQDCLEGALSISIFNIPKTGNPLEGRLLGNVSCHQGPGQGLVNLLLRETNG